MYIFIYLLVLNVNFEFMSMNPYEFSTCFFNLNIVFKRYTSHCKNTEIIQIR